MCDHDGAIGVINSGYGYWDVTTYPLGGDFRRAVTDIRIMRAVVYSRYTDESPRTLSLVLADGRKAVADASSVTLACGVLLY